MIAEAGRHKFPLSLLVLDVDHFKKINDGLGHATGDVVLKAIGNLMRQSCRVEDVAACFGGEEFVMLLGHCSSVDAQAKAETLRLKLEQLRPQEIPVTVSIGVATLSLDLPCAFEQLFNAADNAVYQAKQQGRNRVVLS
jgi:two-component system, cell cycle response regulator